MNTEAIFRASDNTLNEIRLLKSEIAASKADNALLRGEIQELKKENAELKRENAELKKENTELRDEIKRLKGEDPDPNTPSGMTPTYRKENKKSRHLKPGCKKGHKGSRREPPKVNMPPVEHELKQCPDCGCPLCKSIGKRKRVIEDIPVTKPEVTEHIINRYYCKNCCKNVEPVITEALPGSQLGIRFLLITAWLHFGLGMTIGNITKWLNTIVGIEITSSGLTQMWKRLADYLVPLYNDIGKEVRGSPVVHADETGWRVNGKTFWLWCFTTIKAAYYEIRPSRGTDVVLDFFGDAFGGILVSDFWAAYNGVKSMAKQKCLVHMLRELKTTSQNNKNPEWALFAQKFKRLLREAMNLKIRRIVYRDVDYNNRIKHIEKRHETIINGEYYDADVIRIVKRLTKYKDEMFTFLKYEDVPYENNHAERGIRRVVIMRKNSFCNRSEVGAETQAILMSIFKTLSLKEKDPINYLSEYLKNILKKSDCQGTDKLAA